MSVSKLNKDLVDKAVESIVSYASGTTINKEGAELKGKKRKFTESIELQASAGPRCAAPSSKQHT
jgi:hypothetical protein